MAFDLKQSLRLTQQLLMTPQLQQAIKLLQLSRHELEQFISEQLAENPVLEEGVVSSQEERTLSERERESTADQINEARMNEVSSILDKSEGNATQDVDWESFSRHKESEAPIPSSMARRDEELPNYENMITKAANLHDHLATQVGEIEFDEEERKIAMVILGNIDERGYLRTTVEEIADMEGYTAEQIDDVLDTIQRFDPPGVAARDVKECLLLQLRTLGHKSETLKKIINDHMHDLETRNYQAISRALKIPLDKTIENVQIIAELEPIPGRQFGGDSTQFVVPDVYIFKVGEEWVVSMNEEGIPRLQVSQMYKDMLETQAKMKSAEKEYLNDKVRSASWLIKSIQQRQKTIYRVAECILKRQMDFFEKGVDHLKPMILRDIAEDVEMHESTISRVTSNKYMHTPRGIFELKYFFNSSIAKSDGDSVASESVKNMIAELIRGEDTRRPLSDQNIVEMLEEKGVQLARRTVAKYREHMNILPSSKRKKYF